MYGADRDEWFQDRHERLSPPTCDQELRQDSCLPTLGQLQRASLAGRVGACPGELCRAVGTSSVHRRRLASRTGHCLKTVLQFALVFLRAWPQRVAARLGHVEMDKRGLCKSRGVMLSSWLERPWWNTLFPLKGAPDRPDDFILASEGPVRTGKKLAAKIASSTMVAREMEAWRQKLAT